MSARNGHCDLVRALNILGISAFYHDAAACLLQAGRLVAAASEERFSRIKNDPALPSRAVRYCLAQAGLTLADVDLIAYYEEPPLKLERQLYFGQTAQHLPDPNRPLRAIREGLGYTGPIKRFDHHQSHAASSYYFSGFPEAAVLTVDGVGEWTTTSYGLGRGPKLDLFEEVLFPHSLGLFYATLTSFLGFKVNSGEYKVMGLAPYGQPRYVAQLRQMITLEAEGQFRLNLDYYDFVQGESMFSPKLIELLGQPPRVPESALAQWHKDLARSLQCVLEEVLLEKVAYLHQRTQVPNLCLAGGVALNCVANGRILKQGPFKQLFVQPAAGDAGTALGAAALAWLSATEFEGTVAPLDHVYLGPSYDASEILQLLEDTGLPFVSYVGREADLFREVASALQANQVVGWFQGRMEFGPRSLGSRSLLANPMCAEMRDRLNQMVKKRESFRPFAPAVLVEHASQHFDLDHESPYMLETCLVTSPLDLPAITHVDGSARPQTVSFMTNPRFASLLEAFYQLTGCPMLVNTSFNVRGEPIINTPTDALRCLAVAGIDLLVLGDFVVYGKDLPSHWAELVPNWEVVRRSAFAKKGSVISEQLYTFV